MIMFWATLLAVSILLYVVLDGFDLGVGILFGFSIGASFALGPSDAVEYWDN